MRVLNFVAAAALAASAATLTIVPVNAQQTSTGAAPGAAAPAHAGREHHHHMNPILRLLAPLNLTQEQKEQIRPILRTAEQQVREIRKVHAQDHSPLTPAERSKIRDIWQDALQKIQQGNILTSAQKEALAKEIAERKEHRGHHHQHEGQENGSTENGSK